MIRKPTSSPSAESAGVTRLYCGHHEPDDLFGRPLDGVDVKIIREDPTPERIGATIPCSPEYLARAASHARSRLASDVLHDVDLARLRPSRDSMSAPSIQKAGHMPCARDADARLESTVGLREYPSVLSRVDV